MRYSIPKRLSLFLGISLFSFLYLGSVHASNQPVNPNGGFESTPEQIITSDSAPENWNLIFIEDVSYEIISTDVAEGDKALRIEMNTLRGDNPWSVQIFNNGITMHGETLYRYQVWAKADKPATVSFTMNADEQSGYDELGYISVPELSPSWEKHSFVFYNYTQWDTVIAPIHLSHSSNSSHLPITFHFDGLAIIPATTSWAEVSEDGSTLSMCFHFGVEGNDSLSSSNFSVKANGLDVEVTDMVILNSSEIHLTLGTTIPTDYEITVTYDGIGELAYSSDTPKNYPGSLIAAFEDPVENKSLITGVISICPSPGDRRILNITSSSVSIDWAEADSVISWLAEFGPMGFTLGEGTEIDGIDSATLTLADLEAATTYDIYLQAQCGDSSLSSWTGPLRFTTPCAPFSVPLIENFDDSISIPRCWGTTGLNSFNIGTSQSHYTSAPNSINLSHGVGSYAILVPPELEGDLSSYRVSFKARLGSSASNGRIAIGTMGSPTDSSTFAPIDELDITHNVFNPWHTLTVYLNDYVGDDSHIAFKFGSDDAVDGSSILIDDVVIDTIPPCPEPFNIQADSITQSSARIHWESHGTTSNWSVEWGETGFEFGEGNRINGINASPHTINDIPLGSRVSVYIQSNCSDTESSPWVGPYILHTKGQGLVINEVMASNSRTIADEDGDFEDWIELYNNNNVPVNLEGWGLSDSYSNPYKWVFPSLALNPNEYLLVWASGKDRADPPVLHNIIIPEGSEWRYLDDGSDQGTAWREPDFDDSGWASGPGMLGYDTNGNTTFGTTLSFGDNPNHKHIAYYFRKDFHIANPDRYDELDLRLMIDDGAVVYLNGNEVVRQYMPSGTITYTTEARQIVGTLDISYHKIAASLLVEGRNTLAVQVHQCNRTSSDIRFDLELWSQGRYLHTNFAISSSGEEVILTNPSGERIDEIPPHELPTDVSIGRWPDGIDNLLYFNNPTPGEPNHSEGFTEISPKPTFSHAAGFYANPFELSISSTDPDARIIYTLDGSEPNPNNLDGTTYQVKNSYPGTLENYTYTSNLFEEPIGIANRTNDMEVYARMASSFRGRDFFPSGRIFKGNVVRAIAVKDGALPSQEVTMSYFISPNANNRFSLPVMSLSIQGTHLFDYHDGIYVPGVVWDEQAGGTRDGGAPANYQRRGREWEKPAHLEFFERDAINPAIAQNVGVRLHGGWSRAHGMKTLRLYARNSYGEEYFNHRLFPDEPYDSYKRFMLRNSGNDWENSMFRDAAIQVVVAHLGFDVQAYRPVILFVNGEYWGIHNMRERYDSYYIARTWGVDPDNLDYLTVNSEVKQGDNSHYVAMLEYIETNGVAQDRHFEYIKTQMDTENFIDYQIANIYSRNTDWPGNNIDFWRLRTETYIPDAAPGHDGRWRWMLFDTDFGYGIWNNDATHNTLSFAIQPGGGGWPNPDWSTFLLRSLLSNEEFRLHFINRFADLINTTFRPSRVVPIINEMRDAIAPEMREHISRWNRPGSYDGWNDNEVQKMIDFVNDRPNLQFDHIYRTFRTNTTFSFTVGEPFRLSLNVSNADHGYVRVNTININSATVGVSTNPYPWSGRYFQGVPIELEAIPLPGYIFSHWEGVENTKSKLLKQAFSESSVSITAHFKEATSIHYWHFNSLPIGTIESSIPDNSIVSGAALTYRGSSAGYMDRVEDGTTKNASEGIAEGFGLRVRNPSDVRELLIEVPTVGYASITLSYATKRTPNGATKQVVQYRTTPDGPWYQLPQTVEVTTEWAVHRFSFPDEGVKDNPNFTIRIQFLGSQASTESGNNRFDNIRIDGIDKNLTSDCNNKILARTHLLNPLEAWHSQGILHFQNPYNGVSTLTIYGANGSALGNYSVSGSGNHSIQFNPINGVYVARIIGAEGVSAARFVVKD